MPEPAEITPTPMDVYRDWSYSHGHADPGTPLVIHPPEPDADVQIGTRRRIEDDEDPIAVVVVSVAADGSMEWVSHVVGEYALPSEVVEEHGEMLSQAYAPMGALLEGPADAAGKPTWSRKPGR